jgi:hypothetical protein
LQSYLASKYNQDEMIAEVAISSCSSVTSEPFVLPIANKTDPIVRENIQNLTNAGFTDAQFQACLAVTLRGRGERGQGRGERRGEREERRDCS